MSLLMLSGGLDSTVLAHKYVADGVRMHGLFFDLGRPASKGEAGSINLTSRTLNVPVQTISLHVLDQAFYGHIPREALIADELDFDMGGSTLPSRQAKARDGFPAVAALAAFYARAIDAEEIAVAITAEQIKRYPTIPEFFRLLAEAFNTHHPRAMRIRFELPFAKLSKVEVVRLGKKLNVRLENTWSCFHGRTVHDGTCNACLARRNAFAGAKQKDPTVYERRAKQPPQTIRLRRKS